MISGQTPVPGVSGKLLVELYVKVIKSERAEIHEGGEAAFRSENRCDRAKEDRAIRERGEAVRPGHDIVLISIEQNSCSIFNLTSMVEPSMIYEEHYLSKEYLCRFTD